MSVTESATRLPPGPDSAVPLGVDPETLRTLTGLRDTYGNVVCVEKPGGRRAYFVNDPAEVRRILIRHHSHYVKGPGFERVKMLLGNGLIVSDGDAWRRSRTMIQPAFKTQHVHRLLGVMAECSDRCASRWARAAEAGEPVNITEETSEFALDLILVSIFGADYARKFAGAGDNPFAFLSKDSTRDLGVVMKIRELRRLLLEIIAERRADKTTRYDFLGMYLQARDKTGAPFGDNELLDELFTLIVAGFETSANTLNWAWYLLAGHEDVERRVVEEAGRYLPGVDAVRADNLAAMRYTQQVLEETLRLYPPVWLFTRRAREDDRLEHYDVEAGTDIYLSPYLLHRTAQFWSEPDRFDPGRFGLDGKSKKEQAYFPFSLGPRRCLGEYFSFLEMKVHLGLLLPRFRMQRLSDAPPGLELAINLRSKQDILLKPSLRQ